MSVAMEFPLAGKPEQLLELLFAVSISAPRDVCAVHNYEHHIISGRALMPQAVTMIMKVHRLGGQPQIPPFRVPLMLMAHDISAEDPAQLIGQAPPHRCLPHPNTSIEEEALENATSYLVPPLMGYNGGRLRQHPTVRLTDNVLRRYRDAVRAKLPRKGTELLPQARFTVQINITISHCGLLSLAIRRDNGSMIGFDRDTEGPVGSMLQA